VEHRKNLCDQNDLVIRTLLQEPVEHVGCRLEHTSEEHSFRILYLTVIFVLRIFNVSVAMCKHQSIHKIFVGMRIKSIAEIETAYLTHSPEVGIQ
jgi:hypothetical protein